MSFPTVHASTLLKAAAALAGEVIVGGEFAPDDDVVARFTARLSLHLPEIWNANAWTDITVTERRAWQHWFKAGTEYGLGAAVVDYTTGRRWISLLDGNTLGLDDASAWWALQWGITPDAYDATAASAVGDVLFWPETPPWWYVCRVAAAAGVLPSDTDHFARIGNRIPAEFFFDNTLEADDAGGPMGDVLRVTVGDPGTDPDTCEYKFTLNTRGVRVAGDPGSAWFTYRLPVPELGGASVWTAGETYAIGAQVYYHAGGVGDFYDVLDVTVAGESPASTPDKFSVVEIPKLFAVWLTAKVGADWLRWDGGTDKAGDQEQAAGLELDRLHLNLERKQCQVGRLPVRTN